MNIWTHLAAYSLIETQKVVFTTFFSLRMRKIFYKIASNPDNLQFIFPAQADLAETQYVLANYFMKNPLGVWAICDKETNQMVGSIKFEKLDEIRGEAELGYFLRKDFWGKGLMTEAVRELVYLSFEKFQLKELKIVTHVENAGSQKGRFEGWFSSLFVNSKGVDRYTRKNARLL